MKGRDAASQIEELQMVRFADITSGYEHLR